MANDALWNMYVIIISYNSETNDHQQIERHHHEDEPEIFPKEAMDSIKPSKAGKGDFP